MTPRFVLYLLEKIELEEMTHFCGTSDFLVSLSPVMMNSFVSELSFNFRPTIHSVNSLILELDISIHKFKAGRGIWKFNNSLLKNKDYLDIVNKCIEEETIKYAVPIYNLDFLKKQLG